ncbi:MAG: hypothetical protein H6799_02105 [Candidatus Nomurabacteria bacterium]|nr:MAG: hypothetical protein H6799_02105 [Candidatus Nomurabacteria bacterium]HRV75957.1 hypothetical protein [Candidatus Saccharimonadales bacterium]
MSNLDEKQIKRLRNLIKEAEMNLLAAKELLVSLVGDGEELSHTTPYTEPADGETVVEGVFDGQNMIGYNSKIYPVQANYASKSHLVQGDVLKLTIVDGGKFLFKQIGPVARKQLIATITQRDGNYFAQAESKEYKILLASVTHFKLSVGDQATIVVPEENPEAEWAAVEAPL